MTEGTLSPPKRVAIYNDVGFVKAHVDYREPGAESRAGRRFLPDRSSRPLTLRTALQNWTRTKTS